MDKLLKKEEADQKARMRTNIVDSMADSLPRDSNMYAQTSADSVIRTMPCMESLDVLSEAYRRAWAYDDNADLRTVTIFDRPMWCVAAAGRVSEAAPPGAALKAIEVSTLYIHQAVMALPAEVPEKRLMDIVIHAPDHVMVHFLSKTWTVTHKQDLKRLYTEYMTIKARFDRRKAFLRIAAAVGAVSNKKMGAGAAREPTLEFHTHHNQLLCNLNLNHESWS
jgi:hypothetical protein